MPGRLEFDFRFSRPQTQRPGRRGEDSPMRILLMGDFSGRRSQGNENAADLGDRRTVRLDVDNFDQRLAQFAPRVVLPLGLPGGSTHTIAFTNLDDFNPGRLYQRVDLFQGLRDLRARLQNPATFEQATKELRRDAPGSLQSAAVAPAAGADRAGRTEDDTATLDRLLGARAREVAATPASAGQAYVTELIRSIVSPYVIPAASALQGQYLAWVDAATSEQMRSILHHPAFQALEASWRSVRWLVSSLELGPSLQLHLLDVTKAELMTHIQSARGNLESCALYRMLVEQAGGTLGSEPWSLLVGDYTFTTAGEDLELLAAVGALGSQAGAPFLAAASPSLLGCGSLVDSADPRDWRSIDAEAGHGFEKLRRSAVASWIGLALPRILQRLPYGKHIDPVEHLDFEELHPARGHEAYLWGNPALACALLIGQSFLEHGWDMEPGDHQDLVDLPAHVFEKDGERYLQPCAEVLLTERAGEAILSRGLMPLLSYKNRNAVRLMRFQSIAEPHSPLAGGWH